jgi:hypothetical protein
MAFATTAIWLVACAGGCAPHTTAEPAKVVAMKDLVDSLARAHAAEGSSSSFVITIAPTLSNGTHSEARWRDEFPGSMEWSSDTIGRADVATVVETRSNAGRVTRVDVVIYFWDRGRWISESDLARERYPLETAAMEVILRRWFDRPTSRPSSQPATRPAAP